MKLLFYAKRNLHLPHLSPISDWISENHPEINIVYSSPPYAPAIDGIAGLGLSDVMIKQLNQSNTTWIPESEIKLFDPDVTVVADADFGAIDWGGKFVNVNHGLICKGTFYTTASAVQRENGADLICVPGEHHANILKNAIHTPVIATGLVKFDPIGQGIITKESARYQYSIKNNEKVVLLAPTYNPELSAVPVLTDGIRQITRDNTKLLVKLHGMSPQTWVELYELLSIVEENVVLIGDQDITPAILASDVVISDVSSAYMEAIALDKPVVLVNNPLQKTFHHYDPEDIEYKWRDVGIETADLPETIEAVKHCFTNPREKKNLRKKYGPLLVGPIDGKAAERAANAVIVMLENRVSL